MIFTNPKSVKASLILENGQVFNGRSFGHVSEAMGEVIFTSINPGYQEMITDPANTGRILVMTSPLIGNYGINLEDMESSASKINGLIVSEKCDSPSNWRCEMGLAGYLKQQRIMALEGVDTRDLTITLRKHGVMKGIITPRKLSSSQIHEKFAAFSMKNAVKNCTCADIKKYFNEKGKNLAVLDLGINKSLLDSLIRSGANITVFPAFTPTEEILSKRPDEILVSDGPGLPEYIPEVTENLSDLLDSTPDKHRNKSGDDPAFIKAIGLGALCLALASGCKLGKLTYGHHSEAPVKELATGRIFNHPQNHDAYIEYCVPEVTVTHRNVIDHTAEGFELKCRIGDAVGTMLMRKPYA